MKLLADYHTHSKNCRLFISKQSIEDIARKANEMGLVEVAITDHGFKHMFATNKEKLFEARKIIDEINSSGGTKVLLGVEADVISSDGEIDIDDETLSIIDVLIIGYHKGIKTDFANLCGRHKNTDEAIQKATDAFINAINRFNPDILAHPGQGINVDLEKLSKVCADKNVLFELNNRHCDYSKAETKSIIESKCDFVVSSDAYKTNAIGVVDNALLFVEKNNIPKERILNVNYESAIDKEIEEDYERYIKYKNSLKNNHSTLSPEIEAKLMEASGENYNKEEYFDYRELMSEDDKRLIARAEEYIRKHK